VIDKYLNEVPLTVEEMRKSIRKSTLALGKIVPVLAGSAFKKQGDSAAARCRCRLPAVARGCSSGRGA